MSNFFFLERISKLGFSWLYGLETLRALDACKVFFMPMLNSSSGLLVAFKPVLITTFKYFFWKSFFLLVYRFQDDTSENSFR